jgi:hypothetical protein
MYPKPCGRATKKQFRLTKGMDNWFLDTIKPQCTLGTCLVHWTHPSSESSCSSHIRCSISVRLNVNALPVSLSSSSSRASSWHLLLLIQVQALHWLVDLGARSLARRPTTSLLSIHALGPFKSLSKIVWHFELSCKTKLLSGLSLSFARKTYSTSFRNTKGWSLMQLSPKILEVSIEQNKQSSSQAVLQNHCTFNTKVLKLLKSTSKISSIVPT